MAKLTSKKRKGLATSQFALPELGGWRKGSNLAGSLYFPLASRGPTSNPVVESASAETTHL